MSKVKSTKEVEYVASNLEISYTIPIGLTSMLATATKTNNKEVWCRISEMANICASRLVGRLNKRSSRYSYSQSSWTTQTFPGSEVKLRLDMDGRINYEKWDANTKQYISLSEPKMTFYCRIKVAGTRNEKFTQQQINDYITDKILLGDDDELCGILEDQTSDSEET